MGHKDNSGRKGTAARFQNAQGLPHMKGKTPMDYRMTGVVFRCRDVPKLAEFYETVLEFPRQCPPVGKPVKNQVYYRFEPGVVIELLGPGGGVPPVSKREDAPATPLLRVDDIEPIV